MISPATLRRLRHIQRVLVRHRVDELINFEHLSGPLRTLLTLGLDDGERVSSDTPRGSRLRGALEDLGPIFVKFGQTLSTRRDLLPDDVAAELVKLQDQVPHFPGTEARDIVEKALNKPVLDLFREFDETPLASASVAQVHTARLHTGESVIVKVLRPGIEERIRTDLGLIYELARLADRFWEEAKRLRPIEVVGEFEKTILDELDLVREASNAAEIRRRFINSNILYIPKVYFDLTRQNVMVMERISGIPIGDVKQLKCEGVDLKTLAERGVEIFFTQVLRDGLFHADMHPGNIFATRDARYIAVDFGIIGSISSEDKHYIAENFRAFFNRDYRRVAEVHIESGWIPRDTRATEFEGAIRAVCEPIFEKPLKDISYGHLLLHLFQVARRFDMQVQPQLVLLQKTLLNIEGLGRDLYPDLDLWQTAKPFLERWYREELGPGASLQRLGSELPLWAQHGPEMPMLIHRVLSNTANGKLNFPIKVQGLESVYRDSRHQHRAMMLTVNGGALLISGALLMSAGVLPVVALISFGLGICCMAGAWLMPKLRS